MSTNVVTLNSGNIMPLVSLGTYRIRGEDIYNALDAALKAGYRSIDTAAVYRNETHILEALSTLLPKYNLTRKDIFITSKLGPVGNQPEKCLQCCQQSLDNLGGDYIDLYLIHWPGTQGLKPENEAQVENRKNSWRIMEKLHKNVYLLNEKTLEIIIGCESFTRWLDGSARAIILVSPLPQGKLKSIGVSNFTKRHMQELMGFCEIKPAVLQTEHHPHLIQKELIDFCRLHDVQFQAYSSLGTSATDNKILKDPTVCEIAQKYEKSPAQILLRWAVQQDISVIPKSTDPVHISQNIDIFDFSISKPDIELLNVLNKNHHYCWNPEKIT